MNTVDMMVKKLIEKLNSALTDSEVFVPRCRTCRSDPTYMFMERIDIKSGETVSIDFWYVNTSSGKSDHLHEEISKHDKANTLAIVKCLSCETIQENKQQLI